MIEEWHAVPGYEGLYEVSDRGRVRSLDHDLQQRHGRNPAFKALRLIRGRILRTTPDRRGYVSVMLSADGRTRRDYVHRLVLLAFVGPPPTPEHEGAHWDNVRSNNALGNLRWATHEENAADRVRHGTKCGPPRKSICPHGHPYEGDNVRVAKDGSHVCITCQREACRKSEGNNPETRKRRPLPKALRAMIVAEQIGLCAECSGALVEFQVDHIIAVWRGGGDERANLRAICTRPCHERKTAEENAERAKLERIKVRQGLLKPKLSKQARRQAALDRWRDMP